MQNLKIRVNNEAEAEEVKRLAVKAGYKLDALFSRKWSAEFCYLVLCENMAAGFGNEIMADGDKPLSIGELRDMVVLKRNDVSDATHESSIYKYFKACDDWYYFDLGCTDKWQKSSGAKPEYYEKLKPIEKNMKEYLDKDYVLREVKQTSGDNRVPSDWIEIPEGAEVATICRNYIIFWKDEKYSFSVSEENKWCYKSCDDSGYFSLGEYMSEYGDVSIIWQREQDEPFLTPETTLNDQYAEIEKWAASVKASWNSIDMQRIENVAKAAKAIADSWPSIGAGAKANTEIHGTIKAEPDFNFGAAQSIKDNVNHPSHYTQGKVECIDALESATIGKSGIEAVCVANVIKYLWRYEEKNGAEDVKKAQFYLNRLLATLENNNG